MEHTNYLIPEKVFNFPAQELQSRKKNYRCLLCLLCCHPSPLELSDHEIHITEYKTGVMPGLSAAQGGARTTKRHRRIRRRFSSTSPSPKTHVRFCASPPQFTEGHATATKRSVCQGRTRAKGCHSARCKVTCYAVRSCVALARSALCYVNEPVESTENNLNRFESGRFKTRTRDKVGRAGPTPLRIISYFQSVSGERRFPLCQKRRGAAATELESWGLEAD